MQPTPRVVLAVRSYLNAIAPPDDVPALAVRIKHAVDIAMSPYPSTPAEKLDAIREVLAAGIDYVNRLAEKVDREADR